MRLINFFENYQEYILGSQKVKRSLLLDASASGCHEAKAFEDTAICGTAFSEKYKKN